MKSGDLVRLQSGRSKYTALNKSSKRFHDLYPDELGLFLENTDGHDAALFGVIVVLLSPGVLEVVSGTR